MLLSALAFLAGICLLFSAERLPAAGALWALALLLLLCLYLCRYRCCRWWRWPTLALAGFCWAALQAGQLVALRLPPALEASDLQVRGVLDGVPERLAGGRLRLRFQIETYYSELGWRPLVLPVRLTWYRDAPVMKPGERWQLKVRLKAAHGLANPAGFNFERWLFAHGIRATGYVKKDAGNRRLAAARSPPWQRLRQHLTDVLTQLDLPESERALMRALAIGDRGGMTRSQWDLLAHTGTSHLLAISGLHVGLVAGLVFYLVEVLWRRLGGGRYWASPRAAALGAMLAALAYALLSGFQIPAQRALVMVWLWMLALLGTRRIQPWNLFGQALWLILLVDPLAVLTAGFWLSFSAVALILYLSRGRYPHGGRIRRTLIVQFGLVTGITPLLWLWFQHASPTAPLANLAAIPWVAWAVVPPLFAGLLVLPLSAPAGGALLTITGWSLGGLWRFLQLLDVGAAGQWYAPPQSAAGLALFTVGVLALLLPAATGLRGVAVLLLLPLMTSAPERPAPGDLWLTLLDVGQGLSAVVETHEHVLVYDAGPAYPGGFDSGTSVVLPFLRSRGYRHLDRLVISHADNDHSGGGASVYRQLPVTSVHSGEPRQLDWAPAIDCRQQPAWQWDGVQFRYLVATVAETGNNASCVLAITAADGRGVLLPGDIERSVETALLDACRAQLPARVLVAPHHGSRTSSSAGFIAAVHPDWVLFATGYRNRFGFPKLEVVTRYATIGSRRVDTATAGSIHVRIVAGQPAVRVERWRQRHRHIWMTDD